MPAKLILNTHKILIIALSGILFFQCKSKKIQKEETFQSIANYFLIKRWNFPVNILDTTLSIKYYGDSSNLNRMPENLNKDIEKIKDLYRRQNNGEKLLEITLIQETNKQIFGYSASLPTIYIDTSEFGSATKPKLFLGFFISKYKINKDSLNLGLPCENCISEEKNKILRYPDGIFFELNKRKDSLIFSRWD